MWQLSYFPDGKGETLLNKKRKDTDYLCLSAQIRSKECNLLDRARMERMLEAPTLQEAVRLLTEVGYENFDPNSESGLNHALLLRREALFEEIYRYAPEPQIIDVFKLKYDYHNLKAVIKSRGSDVSALLVDAGRVSAADLVNKHQESGSWDFLPPAMAEAAREGERVLAETGDPQRSDALMDRAFYAEMHQLAEGIHCPYLMRYVETTIDAANLRSVIRTLRMGRSAAFLKDFLFPGGTVSPDAVLRDAVNGDAGNAYRATVLRDAAAVGEDAVKSGASLTEFEKLCDDAVLAQAGTARRVPFGVEVVIGYVAAREAELTNVRIIMTGRMAGLPAQTIRERLRESYV